VVNIDRADAVVHLEKPGAVTLERDRTHAHVENNPSSQARNLHISDAIVDAGLKARWKDQRPVRTDMTGGHTVGVHETEVQAAPLPYRDNLESVRNLGARSCPPTEETKEAEAG
jgi:hypothetical protein